MKTVFAHLSDIHIKKNRTTSSLTVDFDNVGDPVEKLQTALASIKAHKVDFVVITGDLVHEGDEEDYRYVKDLLDTGLGDIPYCMALGNHDMKEPFRKVFHKGERQGRCDDIADYGNVRVLLIDAGEEKQNKGNITKEQALWLKEQTEQACGRDVIVAFHHPLLTGFPGLDTEVPEEFDQLMESGKITGIFCGHTHMNQVTFYHGVPHITAEGMGFGVGLYDEKICMNNHAAYGLCTIEEGILSIQQMPVSPTPKKSNHELFSKKMKERMTK